MSISTPSRREFLAYAAATLASGCRNIPRQTRDTKLLPLVVDVVGPMAFRWSGTEFELWMPIIANFRHEAGIMTSLTSFELPKDNYKISGPSSFEGNPTLYQTGDGQVFRTQVTQRSDKESYIHMSLPKPRHIVVLDPVRAKIYPTSSTPPSKDEVYATGVRLRYDHAGDPTLHDSKGASDLVTNGRVPFDRAPEETQLNMLIGYEANDSADPNYAESKASFNAVSLLFDKLDLQVEFDSQPMIGPHPVVPPLSGFFRDCRSPVIGVGGGS